MSLMSWLIWSSSLAAGSGVGGPAWPADDSAVPDGETLGLRLAPGSNEPVGPAANETP